MGTFLRVWRSEWARLSQAQLANAVQRHLNGHRPVTTGVVRWWEQGQPPAGTEELEALCRVLEAHQISAAEVEQFKSVVFAACVDRHYPGLLPPYVSVDDETILQTAVRYEDAARCNVGVPQTIAVVAILSELGPLVLGRLHAPAPGTREQAQDAAYVLLLNALAGCHSRAGRLVLARDTFCRSSAILAQRLGGAVSEWVDLPLNRLRWLYHSSIIDGPRSVEGEMLDIYHSALEQHSSCVAGTALEWLLDMARRPGQETLRARLLPLDDGELELTAGDAGGITAPGIRYQEGMCALVDGKMDVAERCWGAIDQWRHSTEWDRLCWSVYAGKFAWAEHNWEATERHMLRAADIARAIGNTYERDGLKIAEDARRARETSGKRKARPRG